LTIDVTVVVEEGHGVKTEEAGRWLEN
jgi:hypothetical protein